MRDPFFGMTPDQIDITRKVNKLQSRVVNSQLEFRRLEQKVAKHRQDIHKDRHLTGRFVRDLDEDFEKIQAKRSGSSNQVQQRSKTSRQIDEERNKRLEKQKQQKKAKRIVGQPLQQTNDESEDGTHQGRQRIHGCYKKFDTFEKAQARCQDDVCKFCGSQITQE